MNGYSSEGPIPRRPDLFRALGPHEPPSTVEIAGVPYAFRSGLKHDSWAATALYESDEGGRVVCKFNRTQPILVVPAGWIGRLLAVREAGVLEAMSDTEGFPRSPGPVYSEGRLLRNAVAHCWIDGLTFTPAARVNDRFFPTLSSMIKVFHSRGMAYVDMPKWENLLVGADGRPYLIDYQIRFKPLRYLPLGWLLRMLQQADLYYLGRHWMRTRPDQISDQDRKAWSQAPPVVRFGERAATLWRMLRRIGLRLWGVKRDPRMESS